MSLCFTNASAPSSPTASRTSEPPLLSNSPCSQRSWARSRKCCSQQEVNVLQRLDGCWWSAVKQHKQYRPCYRAAEEMALGLPAVLRLYIYWPAIAAFNGKNTSASFFLLPQESPKQYQYKEARCCCSYDAHCVRFCQYQHVFLWRRAIQLWFVLEGRTEN